MPTIEADSKTTNEHKCPLCDTPLDPASPNECPRCDWVLGYRRRQASPLGTQRDAISVALSVVPGLGHLYKGHYLSGMLLMAGGVFAIFACGLIATATMGFGLLLLPLYWFGIMMQVYWLEDRRSGSGASSLPTVRRSQGV